MTQELRNLGWLELRHMAGKCKCSALFASDHGLTMPALACSTRCGKLLRV